MLVSCSKNETSTYCNPIDLDDSYMVYNSEHNLSYRSGLLWDCFMKNEDVRKGLDKLGFTY